MADDTRERLRDLLTNGSVRLSPVTFAQRELWEAAALPPAHVSNHIGAVIRIHGEVTPTLLETALRLVAERQASLRTSILPGKERPVQVVRSRAMPVLRYHDSPSARAVPDEGVEWAEDFRREPFDLARQSLCRIDVLRRAAEDHVLVMTIHHAIADGWSIGVFIREFVEAYGRARTGAARMPPLPVSYGVWGAMAGAAWPADELARRAAFWRSHLAGASRLWPETTPVSGVLMRQVVRVPEDHAQALRDLARRHGATLFSTLLAAFRIAMCRWTGVPDLVVGTPVANRAPGDVRDVIGCFAGNVPLRGHVLDGMKFSQHLGRVHQSTIDCLANAMPFVELVKALDDPPTPCHHPVYQVRFALQNHPVPKVALPGLTARFALQSTGTARFDLGCEIEADGASLAVNWLFRPDRFDAFDIATLASLFLGVLTRVCASPEEPA